MTAKELVEKYHIQLAVDGIHIGIFERKYTKLAEQDKIMPELKERKPELLAYLKEERERELREIEEQLAEHKRKLAEIPGYNALCAAVDAEEEYHEAFNRAMERGDGFVPSRPSVRSADLRKEYPIAAAYELALSYSRAAHHAKAAAGHEAEQKILNDPSCWESAIVEMERQWSEYVDEHIWD